MLAPAEIWKFKTLALIDLNGLLYKMAHGFSKYKTITGEPIGGLVGSFMFITEIMNTMEVNKIIACDDRKPYIRSEEYPEYKTFRKLQQTPESKEIDRRVKNDKDILVNCLELLDIPVWGMQGYEADDLIAHAVIKYRKDFDIIINTSLDSDMHALFRFNNYVVYDKKRGLITKSDFLEMFGVRPVYWDLVTALMGSHNGVEGIHGCGIKTAIKEVKKRDSVLITLNKDLVYRNLNLIKLPHPDFPTKNDLPAIPVMNKVRKQQLLRYLSQFSYTPLPHTLKGLSNYDLF